MKSGFQKVRFAGLLGFTLFLIFAGCAQMRDTGERPRKGPSYYEHKVKWTGETLSIIAAFGRRVLTRRNQSPGSKAGSNSNGCEQLIPKQSGF